MKRSQFTDQQVAFNLRQAEVGTAVEEVCRKAGISVQTYCLVAEEVRPADDVGDAATEAAQGGEPTASHRSCTG